MEERLIFVTVVLVLGIAAQWLAWRLRLPSILLLLAAGYMVGALGNFQPDELIGTELMFPLVSLAVSVILLEGGLTLRFRELKDDTGNAVFRLVSIGVLVAWLLTGVSAHLLLGLHWRVAVLIGAVLVVTGPTVVAPLIRYIRPSRRMASIIKWEGIVIDPIGAILAVLTYEAFFAGGNAFLVLLKSLGIGFGIGWLTCQAIVQLLKRYWIPDFLHAAVILAAGVGTFALSNQLAPESGLITVTVLGIALANQKHVPMLHVLEFKENLRVLLISSLFIVLAARIQPSSLMDVGWKGLVFVVLLIAVIRPLSVFLAMLGTGLQMRERLFLSFLAPRGIVAAAVASVFALELQHHGGESYPGVESIVPITFLVIVGTVAVYGLGAAPMAKALGLSVPDPQGILFAGASPWICKIAKVLAEEGFLVKLVDTNYRNVSDARMLGLKAECGSIVSEYVAEEMDLAGIGRLLAMTPNDELNSLAAMEYAHLFGRKNVYQLQPWGGGVGHREVSQHMRGRFLFHEIATYQQMDLRMADDKEIKKTKITEEFSYHDFKRHYGSSALLLFVIDDGKLLIVTTEEAENVTPKPGQTVIALVDEQQESERGRQLTTSDGVESGK